VTAPGDEPVDRPPRIATFWREHRARWSLPLVIIVIIGVVAIIDHLGSRRISQAVVPRPPALVATAGGTTTVDLDKAWSGFNPWTPAGAASSTPMLLSSVLPSAYVMGPKLIPLINGDLLLSVEATSTSPLTIQYVINPAAVWSDGVPVSVDDFVYAWQSQRGGAVDVDGQPDQVASTIGYRDIASVVGSNGGKTVTVVFTQTFTDWRILFDHLLPAHVAERVGWNAGFAHFDPSVELSAGPMILQSATATTAVLVRNPRWWGTPAVLKKITLSVGVPPSTWLETMAVNSETVVQVNRFDLAAIDAVTALPNTQSTVRPSLSFLELDFDVRSTVTSRVELRQAVAHLVDRTTLLAGTFGAIAPNMMVSNDHLATPAQSQYTTSPAASTYATPDAASAGVTLRGLGYHLDPSGRYVDASGRPLMLRMAVETGDPWVEGVASALVAQFRAAGMVVQLESVDGPSGMSAAAQAGSYDMALVTRVATPFPTVTEAWYSDTGGIAGTGRTENWSRLVDPQIDQLFLQASEALNPVTGGTFYAQVDNQLWDQMVALPLFEEPVLLANGVRIANVQFNPSADGLLWNVDTWTTLKPGPPTAKS
jgi:peptide/nickel transport system substrate-binding protein